MVRKLAFVGFGVGSALRPSLLRPSPPPVAPRTAARALSHARPLSRARAHAPPAMVAAGDEMPRDVQLMTLGADGKPAGVSSGDVFGSGTVALVTIPGALTSTCRQSHVPQWMAAAAAMRAKGARAVVCMAVNDPFVLRAFEEALGAAGELTFVGDGGAALTRRLALDVDTGAFGGVRCKRASFVLRDGVFTHVNVEPDGTGYSGPSKPDTVLAQL